MEKLVKSKLAGGYAFGGATALLYYFEPINTQDVDVFVVLNSDEHTELVNLSPIYEFFTHEGCKFKNEYLLVGNIPLQILVPYNELLKEAVDHAKTVRYGKQKARLFTLEYLMAIMIQTGRLKDRARLEEIQKLGIKYNKRVFARILKKHALESKWRKQKKSFK